MTVLLQVSDPHFGTKRPEVVDALERFVHELRPGVLLLSGDITQRATAAQFAAARAFVDRLAVPTVLAIPGNRDTPLFNVMGRLFSPYAHCARAFGNALEPEYENNDVLVLAVNTTRWYGTPMARSRPRKSSAWRTGWRRHGPACGASSSCTSRSLGPWRSDTTFRTCVGA